MKRILIFLLLAILALANVQPVLAGDGPSCHFEADGSLVCSTGGGGEGGGDPGGSGGGESGGEVSQCQPGETHFQYVLLSHDPQSETCTVMGAYLGCNGELIEGGEIEENVPCTVPEQPDNPCDQFSVSSGGITCQSFEWQVRARVTFPEIYLDVRPYPATLVRWPTALRNGGMNESSGSGTVGYIPYGGGSPGSPQAGDWRDLRLTLSLRPAGLLSVSLPHIGSLSLPNVGSSGNPTIVHWELPSHPEAGGGPLAGSIPGLNELPADLPVFTGQGRAPYRLFWELRYYVYEVKRDCLPGPNGQGQYNCGGGTGHKEIVGYEWKRHSSGGEISPLAVTDLPASLMADLNGDGLPEAYWNNNLTLRRMDDADRVDNPTYQHSWNWGGAIYWAVREGQGQIGWPGQ